MSAMYTPPNGHRPPEQSSHRRSQSDPGRSYVIPPYTVRRPVPGRTSTPYPHSSSHSSSAERIADPFHAGSLHARQPTSHARAPPPSPASPRSPSPHPGHQRGSSRHGSIKITELTGSLIRDIPQPHRPAPSVIVAPVTWTGSGAPGHAQSPPTLSQSAGMYHGASHRHHHYNDPSTTHHAVHPRTRPRTRPPVAASHRYATSITQPVYGHGSSMASNASRTSLEVNGGVTSQRHARMPVPMPMPSPSPPPASHHDHRSDLHVPPESPFYKSLSATRGSSVSGSIAPPHSVHQLDEIKMPHTQRLMADEIRRHPDRPALPANYDGQQETRYVNMLLALDGISPIYNVLSALFTWTLLAGFVLLPATFASFRNNVTVAQISSVINNGTLFIIAFVCTGIGGCGMIWLWWRWHGNYIWVTNRIFLPGCLNSLAGLVSTLSNIYGIQGGMLGRTELSAVVVTSSTSLICGILFVVYEYWFIRNLRLEHDQEVGVELAGKYGAGVLEEKRNGQA